MATKSIKFLASSEEWEFEGKDGKHIDSISLKLTVGEGKMAREMLRGFLKTYNPGNMLMIKIKPQEVSENEMPPLLSEVEIEEIGSLIK